MNTLKKYQSITVVFLLLIGIVNYLTVVRCRSPIPQSRRT